jgi:hypothetical protein
MVTYDGVFVVMEMRTNEVIIGLPAIITKLWSFLKENFEERRSRYPSLNPSVVVNQQSDSLAGSKGAGDYDESLTDGDDCQSAQRDRRPSNA